MELVEKAKELLPLVEDKIKRSEQSLVTMYRDTKWEHHVTQLSVRQHPVKIVSHNFDKNPEVTGVLQGIKGQYLILDAGVINIRKFGSYEVEVSA